MLSHRRRNILFVKDTAFKAPFGVNCIANDTANIRVLFALKNCFEARLFY